MSVVSHWMGGTLFVGLLAAGLGGCGGSSSSKDDEGSGGGGGTTSGDGTTGGSGGTTDGATGSNAGNETVSSSSSGNTTVGIVQGDPVPFEDYPAEVSAIVCDWITPCCAGLGLTLTEAECSATLGASLDMQYADADPSNYTYDPEVAGDCVATARKFYDQVGCAPPGDPSAGIDASAVEVCDTVFQGKIEPGAPCAGDIECRKSPGDDADCTELDFGSEAKVCVIERQAAEGDPCYWSCTGNPSVSSCFGIPADETPAVQGKCYSDDQLYCADGVCAKQPELGEPCGGDATCSEGYCSASGQCSSADNEGAACSEDTECSERLYCESLVCTAKKAIGAACYFNAECQSDNCDESACAEASDTNIAIAFACAFASGQL